MTWNPRTKKVMHDWWELTGLASIVGLTLWLIAGTYFGFVMTLVMAWPLILILVLIYLISLILTVMRSIRDNPHFQRNTSQIAHISFGLILVVFTVFTSEIFKSKRVLEATLVDDLSAIRLVLRENGKFECTAMGFMGIVNRKKGHYRIAADTLIFLDRPYGNNFIPNKLLVSLPDNAVYLRRNVSGRFLREKSYAEYFDIWSVDQERLKLLSHN